MDLSDGVVREDLAILTEIDLTGLVLIADVNLQFIVACCHQVSIILLNVVECQELCNCCLSSCGLVGLLCVGAIGGLKGVDLTLAGSNDHISAVLAEAACCDVFIRVFKLFLEFDL